MNKGISRIGVYPKLKVLKNPDLVNVSWTEKEKFYKISPKGISVITEFKN
jgi:DNA-binding PadR family transcriptional regulator